jgi:hypothetical protein
MCYIIITPKGGRKDGRNMKEYFWMHKENGYLVRESGLFDDAMLNGYDDVTDPCSVEYGNYELYYEKTNMAVK